MDQKKYFKMGKIVNTHGIKGDVKIYSYAMDNDVFHSIKKIKIDGFEKETVVTRVKFVKNMVVLKLQGYNHINELNELMDKDIYVRRELISDDKEGHYVVDLIGSDIIDAKKGKVGVLKDVLQHTSQDVYLVQKSESNETFMIPVVDEFVLDINIDTKEIQVNLIEGLID